MAEAEKVDGGGTAPPTTPDRGAAVPDPATGSEPEGEDPVREAERAPDDPDAAARDGLA